MEEVGQKVWHRDALLWFIGAQERSHCCSEAAVRSVHREGALLLSGKQMKRFDATSGVRAIWGVAERRQRAGDEGQGEAVQWHGSARKPPVPLRHPGN